MNRKLLIYHLLGGLLLVSYLLPTFWPFLDEKLFISTNSFLQDHPRASLFWAFANHKVVDWLEDLGILLFFTLGIRTAPKGQKIRRAAQLLFSAVFIAATIILINRLLCHDLLRFRRASPTSVYEGAYRLSEALPWLGIKDISAKSFPGDHATTALLFGISYATYVKGRLSFAALAFSIFLTLPRLMTGAHWLSDITVGSGIIICFSWGIAVGTPLTDWGTHQFEKLLLKLSFWYKRPYDKTL